MPILVGVAGGTASGKTMLCQAISEQLGVHCVILEMDHFYRGLTANDVASEYNFDSPEAIDFAEASRVLSELMEGRASQVPIYDFVTHRRSAETREMQSAEVILYEGLFALYDEDIRSRMKIKIFVQTDDDIRLGRRLKRDLQSRGRDIEGVLYQYFKFVKPSFDDVIAPTSKFADIIVPNWNTNTVSIRMIVNTLKAYLQAN
jgi:uridine kinase